MVPEYTDEYSNRKEWLPQIWSISFYIDSLHQLCTNSILCKRCGIRKDVFFAYIAIIEVILKLLIVVLLIYVGFDKLRLYSILTFLVAVLVFCLLQVLL